MCIDFGERERNIDVREKHRLVASYTHPNQGSNLQLGMCPNQESNPEPSGIWNDTLAS